MGKKFTDPDEIRNDDADRVSVQYQPLSFRICKDPAHSRHLAKRKAHIFNAVRPIATKSGKVTQIAVAYMSSVKILN